MGNYKITGIKYEITESKDSQFDKFDIVRQLIKTMQDINQTSITISYKDEEITLTIRIHHEVLYVLDTDYDKYMSSNNELFKSIFSDCPTFEELRI